MSGSPRDRFRAPIALALLLTLVLSAGALGLAGTAHASRPSVPAPVTPVTGSITGPSVLAYNAAEFYTINGSGGPAVSPTGEMIGNITYYAALSANNLTGVTINPSTGAITNSSTAHTTLTVYNVSETVTIHVMISSVYLDQNQSINLTFAVLVVQPYHLTVSLVAGPTSTVLSFQISIYLDGQFAGIYTVPTLTPGQTYTIDWQYAAPPLSTGWHTFTMTIPTADKGLVTFPNGQYNYAYSFYITGPAPDYTIWIVLGVIAFVAVVFISLILVGGRRRNRGRS